MANQLVEAAQQASQETVWAFVRDYQAAAIPALIGACVMWAVEHGGAEVVKGSLGRAIKLADEMEAARRKVLA